MTGTGNIYTIKKDRGGWFRIARNGRSLEHIPFLLGVSGWNLYRTKRAAQVDLEAFKETGVLS